MARKPSESVQLKLRFSDALRRQLERAASAGDRSMNSEIVRRLERSFRTEQSNLLFAITTATIGKSPKWSTPDNGKEIGFSPDIKATMKAKLAAFIDSLPDAPPSTLTKEEADELWETVQRHKKVVPGKKATP